MLSIGPPFPELLFTYCCVADVIHGVCKLDYGPPRRRRHSERHFPGAHEAALAAPHAAVRRDRRLSAQRAESKLTAPPVWSKKAQTCSGSS